METIAIGCILIALAHPLGWSKGTAGPEHKTGIDIVLAVDVSLSMYAKDFVPNRLEVAKSVASDFVGSRTGDRVGLVIYAGEAYTACPSTTDYSIVQQQLSQLSGEYLEGGTAIGVGLGTAVARLRGDSLSTKVVILLTDGTNNAGELSPQMAAELAASQNIRVYTIGVGSNGEAPSPVVTPFGIRFETIPVEIDEETLKAIAQRTGGKYYRATDEEGLKRIYEEIDLIEKRRFVEEVHSGNPPVSIQPWLLTAMILLISTVIFQYSILPYYE